MNIIMKNLCIKSISEMESFLQGNRGAHFVVESAKDKYEFISDTLVLFDYKNVKKKYKGIILKYLKKITGYSNSQMKRLVKKWKVKGLKWSDRKRTGTSFERKYKANDIALLIKTDSAHKCLNGNATKMIMEREFKVFGKSEYENISRVSVSHLYNIRNDNRQYNSSEAIRYTKTQATQVSIGERKKPEPDGKQGFLRIDSVHQGDRDKKKGVYHINVVDEVTQWEVVGCVDGISEYFLAPMLKGLLKQFPYKIFNFHSDNGSEYINKTVAKILNKLLIKQTKSRSRKTNDNALVESKNGSIIRKHIGRNHIPRKYAMEINNFYKKYFNTYLNYHRVCAFPVEKVDKKGKVRKTYPKDNYMTPYDKLKSLKDVELIKGVSFGVLDKIAYDKSDNEFAEKMKIAKTELFTSFKI